MKNPVELSEYLGLRQQIVSNQTYHEAPNQKKLKFLQLK